MKKLFTEGEFQLITLILLCMMTTLLFIIAVRVTNQQAEVTYTYKAMQGYTPGGCTRFNEIQDNIGTNQDELTGNLADVIRKIDSCRMELRKKH